MLGQSLKTRVLAATVLAAVFAVIWFVVPSGPAGAEGEPPAKKDAGMPGEALYPVNQYGWHSFYMRQLFTRYTEAKKYFDQGNFEQAEANVAVMRLFVEQLVSERMKFSKQEVGDPKKDQCCQDTTAAITAQVGELQALIKDKKWFDVPAGGPDPMLQTCGQCHLEFGAPKDVLSQPQFKTCTVGQREVYELFTLAGYYMKDQQWDKARAIVIVLGPYVEALKENIPEKDKAGEPIDKEKYLTAYREIKQYTDDLAKRLESKNFEGGKPLPPPRLVVSICADCHAAAGDLPMAW